MVAHDGVVVMATLGVVAALAAGYGGLTVPVLGGGKLPVWLLSPPALALFAGLAVDSRIPALPWSHGLAAARLGWVCFVALAGGVGGALIGASAGQTDLARSAVLLIGLVYGASVVVGRFAPLLAAIPIVVILGNVDAAKALTPGRLWDDLPNPALVMLGLTWCACVFGYSRWGARS